MGNNDLWCLLTIVPSQRIIKLFKTLNAASPGSQLSSSVSIAARKVVGMEWPAKSIKVSVPTKSCRSSQYFIQSAALVSVLSTSVALAPSPVKEIEQILYDGIQRHLAG